MKNFSCRALQVFFRRPVYISNYFSCATDTCDHLKKKVQSPDFTRSNQIFILPLVRMVCATVNHILLESRCYLIPFGIIVHSTNSLLWKKCIEQHWIKRHWLIDWCFRLVKYLCCSMVNAFDQLKCHVAAHEWGNSQSVLLLHPLCRGLGR